LKQDVAYTLKRVGDTRALRGESSSAEAAYFEAVSISLELLDNDERNASYMEDVAAGMQKVGALYRSAAPEYALAFYQYAAAVRANALQTAANRTAAQAKLQAVEKIIGTLQGEIDAARQAGLTGLWWRARVIDAVDHFATQRLIHERDPDSCWNGVVTFVNEIIGPAPIPALL
jgi:hypothetical protein